MKKIICVITAICTLIFVGCSTNNTSTSTNEKKVVSSESTLKKDTSANNKKVVKSENITTKSNDISNGAEEKVEPQTVTPEPTTNTDVKIVETQQSIYPSEDEIMNLVTGAENALIPILKGPALFSKNPLIIDNIYYGEVTNFNSREEMATSLRGYFTEDVINSILDKYLLEKDGKLYFTIGQAGMRINYYSCIKNFSYDNNRITVTLSSDTVTEIKTLELINGQWLFTEFWYV